MEFPSLTKTWHTTSYPAIDPAQPSPFLAGKTVLITGGGTGIGLATACAFATAGVSRIVVTGRTEKTLTAAKGRIQATNKDTAVETAVADVADRAAIDKISTSIGSIDILVSNAAYLPDAAPVSTADIDDWWSGFETNVKGAFNVTQAFLKVAAPEAILIDVAASMILRDMPNMSAYRASKLAQLKFFDAVQLENPGLHIVHIHPGIVSTETGDKALRTVVSGNISAPDDVSLPAGFIVWTTRPEARFLKGKMVYANWDVEELKAMEAEIRNSQMLTITLDGMSSFKYTSKSTK